MTPRSKPTAARFLARCSLFLLPLLALVIYLYCVTLPATNSSNLQTFAVTKGETASVIASHLYQSGLIRSPLYFRYLVRRDNLTLQAGVYQLSPSTSTQAIAESLTKGRSEDKKLTIPEGFRLEQIATVAGLDPKEFLRSARGLEGQLFPDTYFVPEDLTPDGLVKIMHDNFLTKVGQLDHDTLVLASLVERETRGDNEKPLVAGILKKRLEAGWPLELDATIQFALGTSREWWPKTTLLDRKVISPYNTYLHRGLPPEPICSPGLASIRAVQNAVASPYWFYLHDSRGDIHYATTNSEHSVNIDKFLR